MNPGPEDELLQPVGSPPNRWNPVQFQRPIVLLGCTPEGQEITAHATAVVVGAEGCILRVQEPLSFLGRVTLGCDYKEIEGQLQVSEPLERNYAADNFGRVQYLVRFDRTDAQFWGVHLEPMEGDGKVAVECSACRFSMSAELGIEEAMVFAADSAVVLRCPSCRADTRFMLSQERSGIVEDGPDPNLVVSGHDIYHLRPQKKEVNEREFRRVTTKTKAYLRIPGREDDVVEVLDISRGGLRFESLNNYEKGMEFDIALHYVQGGNNIFQRAKIVRKQRRPSEYFPGEYGVMFIGGSKLG